MAGKRLSYRTTAVVVSAFALMFSVSCAPGVLAGGDDVREEFHQTYPLAADGQVELENVNGDVTITAGETNSVRVDAVKLGRDKERLRDCQVVVEARPNSIHIRTKYVHEFFNWNNREPRVEYKVTVPRMAKLDPVTLVNGHLTISAVAGAVRASSVNGAVDLREAGGPVELSTVNGSLNAEVRSFAGDSLRLHSVNGGITLTVPADIQARVEASAVNGSIHDDFGLPVEKGFHPGSNLHGRLGTGTGTISLDTVNGSIDLRSGDGKPAHKATDVSDDDHESL